MIVVVLALIALLAIQAPESCSPHVDPIPVTHQVAPINGVPVLFDGVAVSLHCKF